MDAEARSSARKAMARADAQKRKRDEAEQIQGDQILVYEEGI